MATIHHGLHIEILFLIVRGSFKASVCLCKKKNTVTELGKITKRFESRECYENYNFRQPVFYRECAPVLIENISVFSEYILYTEIMSLFRTNALFIQNISAFYTEHNRLLYRTYPPFIQNISVFIQNISVFYKLSKFLTQGQVV